MPPAVVASIKAKNTTNCRYSDFGWVELTLTATPVKFTSFDFQALGNKQVLVTFETAEASNVRLFRVLISTNGVDYKAIDSINADLVTPNRKYSTGFKIDTEPKTEAPVKYYFKIEAVDNDGKTTITPYKQITVN